MGRFYFKELEEARLLLECAIVQFILQRILPGNQVKLKQNLLQGKMLQAPERFEKTGPAIP